MTTLPPNDFAGTIYLAQVRAGAELIQVSLDTEGITWLVFREDGVERFRVWLDHDRTELLTECLGTVVRMGALEP